MFNITNSYQLYYSIIYHRGRKELTEPTEGLPESSTEDISQYYTCRSCGSKFDSFGDMQRHILVEHMQKGDIPSEEESEK